MSMPGESDAPMPLPDEAAVAETFARHEGPDPQGEAAATQQAIDTSAPDELPDVREAATEPNRTNEGPARDENGRFAKLEDDIKSLEERSDLTPAQEQSLKRLHAEHKKYRERYEPFEQAFGSMHPDDAQAVLGFVQLLQADPRQAAEWMRANADRLSPAQEKAMEAVAQQAGAPEAAPSNADDDFDPYDPAQIDRRVEERARSIVEEQLKARDEQQTIQRFRDEIQSTARDLGYEPGTSEYEWLLSEAKAHGGDLNKAHAAIESKLTSRAQALMASKTGDGHVPAPAQGQAPRAGKEPETMDDAEGAARKRLETLGFR